MHTLMFRVYLIEQIVIKVAIEWKQDKPKINDEN